MARYQDALALAAATRTTPNINAVRTDEQEKFGFGVALEQEINKSVGLFARAMWADGATETEAYATIDRSLSLGAVTHGDTWTRGQDTLGAAIAWNRLSATNRDYLAAGGLDFFIGDGKISYGVERIAEVFYNFNLFSTVWLTADFQRIANPAYNSDRGPVSVSALRVHVEF
ncbi:MAG TPA: carbohydrate porin [Steroidobacteraceae bacterium]|nr:carbohydrate porin [Steroidobacteraceae bacterium]